MLDTTYPGTQSIFPTLEFVILLLTEGVVHVVTYLKVSLRRLKKITKNLGQTVGREVDIWPRDHPSSKHER
jgi:hypothetical protein